MGQFAKRILSKLHGGDPYAGFDHTRYPCDLQGTGGHPLFDHLFNAVGPKLVVEVGSWKGVSAVYMAELLRAGSRDGAVVCVDTWLGSLEHWQRRFPEWDIGRYCRHGFPTIYYQFLANVIHKGYQDLIVPFPNTSTTAARWFAAERIRADLVYLDGSHDEEEVFCDLTNYWGVTRPGGVVFGDDWNWRSVGNAVARFAKGKGLQEYVRGKDNKWFLPKVPNPEAQEMTAAFEGGVAKIKTLLDQLLAEGGVSG